MKLIECPRDAMQGIKHWIPTQKKIEYINAVLKCNFDTVDLGSFVSPKTIPQMKDTHQVINNLTAQTRSKFLVIVANVRGAEQAVNFERIDYLGYPFSISETFQQRNANSTVNQSWERLEAIQNIATKNNKKVVVYISMGFGNPYGDPWNADVVIEWCEKIYTQLEIITHSLSDTVGSADSKTIDYLFKKLIPAIPEVEFGAHLHTRRENAQKRIETAYNAGCRRFDGAIKGYGGCPMAKDELVGNMPTEIIIEWLEKQKIKHSVDKNAFKNALNETNNVFL